MSTRFTKSVSDNVSRDMGYEGDNVADFKLPSNTIEDVDRAIFTLFDKEIPFHYDYKTSQRKVPVIFATGERFAVLRRKRPLRDKAGALILPLISINRTGIAQSSTIGAGPGQAAPIVIKKELSPEDESYQTLINKIGFKHTSAPPAGEARRELSNGSMAGVQGTRRTGVGDLEDLINTGQVLAPDISRTITEIITIPPVNFFTAEYEVVFWCQFTQQMNKFLTLLQASYQDNNQRTFRLETPAGYWFVAYVDEALSSANNFDEFTDDERVVRYSFNISVPSYSIPTNIPEIGNPLRTFASSPDVVFETYFEDPGAATDPYGGLLSQSPDQFILADLGAADDGGTAQAVGDLQTEADRDSRNLRDGLASGNRETVMIGGATAGGLGVRLLKKKNPITGKVMVAKSTVPLKVPTPGPYINPYDGPPAVPGNRVGKYKIGKGETVYKDMSDGAANPSISLPVIDDV